MVRRAVVALLVAGCGFRAPAGVEPHDAGTADAADGLDGEDAAGADAPTDAAIDAAPPDAPAPARNLVAVANGGVLESFTSEYCPPNNPPSDCGTGYWNRTNLNDGAHAMGNNATAFRASWSSAYKTSTAPERFVFSFAEGAPAAIERIVIQNWGQGGGGPYYASHFVLHGQAPGSDTWSVILDLPLATNETPQEFDLVTLTGSTAVVGRLRLSLTDGLNNSYWELGELEAWGRPL